MSANRKPLISSSSDQKKPKKMHEKPTVESTANVYTRPTVKRGRIKSIPLAQELATLNQKQLAELIKDVRNDILYIEQQIQRLNLATAGDFGGGISLLGFLSLLERLIRQDQEYKRSQEFRIADNSTGEYTIQDYEAEVYQEQSKYLDENSISNGFNTTYSLLTVGVPFIAALLQGWRKISENQKNTLVRFNNQIPALRNMTLYPVMRGGVLFPRVELEIFNPDNFKKKTNDVEATFTPVDLLRKQMIADKAKIESSIESCKTACIITPASFTLLAALLQIIQKSIASSENQHDPNAPLNNYFYFFITLSLILGGGAGAMLAVRVLVQDQNKTQFENLQDQVLVEDENPNILSGETPPPSPPPEKPKVDKDKKHKKKSHAPMMEENTTPSSATLSRRKTKEQKESKEPKEEPKKKEKHFPFPNTFAGKVSDIFHKSKNESEKKPTDWNEAPTTWAKQETFSNN